MCIRRNIMSRKHIFIVFFLLFLPVLNSSVFAYEVASWTSGAGDGDWWQWLNWDLCEYPPIPEITCVPDQNTYAIIEAMLPGPNVTGDPCCAALYVHPWAWVGAPNAEVNIAPTAGLFNCGFFIGICSEVPFDSATMGHGIINMYGGTVFTPTAEGDTNGLWIGGGQDKTGNCYGVLNMFGGLMTVPRIALYYGVINLHGGILEGTSGATADFIISDRPMNKIDVAGGMLRLNGDRITEIDANIAAGRIVPFEGRGFLVIDYGVRTPGYTTVTAIHDLGIAWNPKPADYQKKVSLDPTLTWTPGDYVSDVNEHQVYFGTSFADVNEANVSNPMGVYKGARDVNNYVPPGPLEVNTIYYWRIDEVNDANSNSPWKGRVWRFTTTPCPYGGSGLVGDFNVDCIVDLFDVGILVHSWLMPSTRVDIYPDIPDGIVDFGDFAIMAKNWLAEQY
jgi:hypothetical protein